MKYKLKDIILNDIDFSKVELQNGTIYNIKYKNDSLEFQTPKMVVDSLLSENEKEYLVLKIIGTQACKTFCSKITEIEELFKNHLKGDIKSVFHEEFVTVKIPMRYSRSLVKVYREDSLFNYYHLEKNMEVICLVSIDKIWSNNFDESSYHLNVKEIMVI